MKKFHIWIAVSVLAFALVGSVSQAAHAHTKVNKSIPEDGATVAPRLSQIELHFTGKMRLTVLKISHAGSGVAVTPATELPRQFVTHVSIEVPPLAAGAYDVKWVGVGSDGHVMNGKFKFSVAEK